MTRKPAGLKDRGREILNFEWGWRLITRAKMTNERGTFDDPRTSFKRRLKSRLRGPWEQMCSATRLEAERNRRDRTSRRGGRRVESPRNSRSSHGWWSQSIGFNEGADLAKTITVHDRPSLSKKDQQPAEQMFRYPSIHFASSVILICHRFFHFIVANGSRNV